jgi:ribosomal protein S18 acetylase RimI-like enzyme
VDWPSLVDPDVVRRMCTAPGSVAYVAEQQGGSVIGWAQALGDGVLQSHLGFVAVHPDFRRRGIGRLLVVATFQATRTLRMDLITDVAQGFYATFAHKRMSGFRIYPGA